MVFILRQSRLNDRLRLFSILHRFREDRLRMHNILRRSHMKDQCRMLNILRRSTQSSQSRLSFFTMFVMTTVVNRCSTLQITDVKSCFFSSEQPITTSQTNLQIDNWSQMYIQVSEFDQKSFFYQHKDISKLTLTMLPLAYVKSC